MTMADATGTGFCDDVPVMPCGQYQGRKITDLPDLYLRWLQTATGNWLSAVFRAAIAGECERRQRAEEAQAARRRPVCDGRASRQVAEEIISAGRRVLALERHPDVGGTTEQMQSVNATADLLLQRVRTGIGAKWNTRG